MSSLPQVQVPARLLAEGDGPTPIITAVNPGHQTAGQLFPVVWSLGHESKPDSRRIHADLHEGKYRCETALQ
jgi:hypothetical protein